MTPINSLNALLEKAVFELSELHTIHNHLDHEHDKLCSEWVVQNHKTDAYEQAVKQMCGNCSQDGSKLCDACPLHDVRAI